MEEDVLKQEEELLFENELEVKKAEKNQGFTTIELALIIVIVIGLLVIFKNQLSTILDSVFTKVTTAVNNF